MKDVLAINGGTPIRNKGWTDNFTTGQEEKDAVLRAMESGYLSKFEGSFTPDPPFSFFGGPYVQELELRWSEYYESPFAVSMNSATSGLYAALGALGIGYGDEVIVSPTTMTACAISPLLYGAIPVFADTEKTTGCLDPVSIQNRITPRTRAILVVHQFGIPADMDAIMKIARTHQLKVIEDCAQAHGAKYRGRWVGTIGDIGVFSLNVNKTIQCGEGGVCITKDRDLHYRLCLIRNHGENVVGPAGIEDITNMIGFNYRLTEIGAAISIEQLKKLPRLNAARLDLVSYLNDKLSRFRFLEVVRGRSECESTYYVYPLLYREEETKTPLTEFRKMLNSEGCFFFAGPGPLYLQPVYQRRWLFKHGYPFSAPENRESVPDYRPGSCPVAEFSVGRGRMLNEHIRYPHTREDMDDLVRIFEKVGRVLV